MFVLNCIALRFVVVDIFQTRSKVLDCIAFPCTLQLPLDCDGYTAASRSWLPELLAAVLPDASDSTRFPFQKCPVSSSPLCSAENKCLWSIFEQKPPQAAQSRWSQTGLSLRT